MSVAEEPLRCPPVLICGFSRPDTLREVFNRVREVKPSQLYLWLNHPREDRPDEVARNTQCREIFAGVDWPCEVHRNYSTVYLKVRDSLEGAFDWFFSQVEYGVILEDDCVPSPDFFRFCGELLEKYKDDGRIGAICGHDENLHVADLDLGKDSYYFDRMFSVWGWASWRRVWQMHDKSLSFWPEMKRRNQLMDVFHDKLVVRTWTTWFDEMYQNIANTWDTAFVMTCLRQNWLMIHPKVNLVSNVGFGKSSRSDTVLDGHVSKTPMDRRPYGKLGFPLNHPIAMIPSFAAERYTQYDCHIPKLFVRFLRFLSRSKWRILGTVGIQKKRI